MAYLEPAAWYAQLPTLYGTAAAVITSPGGEVLLVSPNYREMWSLPGGVLEAGEPPHLGCAREVREEIGLDLVPGRLLAVDWTAPDGDRPRPAVSFVFDGGELEPGSDITLQESELDDWRFVPRAAFADHLPPHLVRRVTAALRAKASGATAYVPYR